MSNFFDRFIYTIIPHFNNIIDNMWIRLINNIHSRGYQKQYN